MLHARVEEIYDGYVVVSKITPNPLYPRFIRVLDVNVLGMAHVGSTGRLTPIGKNQYKFYPDN